MRARLFFFGVPVIRPLKANFYLRQPWARAVAIDGMPSAEDPAGFDRSRSWRISASVKGIKDLVFRVRRRPATRLPFQI